jgi:hypothetical protein
MSGYKSRYRQPAAAASGGTTVEYYELNPSGSPDVVMLFDFEETSGNLVDSINTVTLEPAGANVAQITYNSFYYPSVDDSNIYRDITPGIGFKSAGAYFAATAASTNINPGTGPFTIELFYTVSGRPAGNYMLSLCNAAGVATTGGFLLTVGNVITGSVGYYLRATDGTTVNGDTGPSTKAKTWDYGLHKMRIVRHTTDSKLYIYVDEELIGNINIAALAGKTIQFDGVYLNAAWTGGGEGTAAFYGLRLSRNETNNSGGPDAS